MSLTKKLVSGAAALALAGTAAMATIHIEKDGTGDYLISPVYIANGNGWETKIKVVNTNTTAAVIAKVIVREGTLSKELVDFPLYLTPGDVFEATIKADSDGHIKIVSDDDSAITGLDADGNIVSGVDVDLTKNAGIIGQSCLNEKMGYVEIIGLGDINESVLKNADGNWSVTCPYDKKKLFELAPITGTSIDLGNAVDVADSDLMGQQIIYRNVADDNGKRAMFLNMLAFGDTLPNVPSGNNVLGSDQNLPVLGGSVLNLQDELAKSHVYVMLEGNDKPGYLADPFLTIFTYPYWYASDATCDVNDTQRYVLDENTTIFRDLTEHSNYCDKAPCEVNLSTGTGSSDFYSGPTETNDTTVTCPEHNMTKEVQIVFFHDPEGIGADPWAKKYMFKEGGYIDVDLNANNPGTTNWKGVPVIPTTFYAKKVGDLYLNNHLYNQYLREKK